jgi:hypothetical protein
MRLIALVTVVIELACGGQTSVVDSGLDSSTGTTDSNFPAEVGGPHCSWVAQDGGAVDCYPSQGISCPGPAGPRACSLCSCQDPTANRYVCNTPPCPPVGDR